MITCNKCGAPIAADDHGMSWTLMCNLCHVKYITERRNEMSWTTDYPTSPGFYWIRNYLHYGKSYPGQTIIEVMSDLRFYFLGDDMVYPIDTINSAEWQGPIEPEAEKANRPEFKRSYFPPMDCAVCLKPAPEFISWPTQVADGPHAHRHYSLICRECWIAVLTPEQREAYKV